MPLCRVSSWGRGHRARASRPAEATLKLGVGVAAPMKLWIGHYLGVPDEWFVAWGDTKLEAAAVVYETWGEPDLRSMRVVEMPGALSFRVEPVETEAGEPTPLYLNADDGEEELAIALDDEGLEAWILARAEDPLPEPGSQRQAEAIERTWDEDVPDVVPDCPCFWERDVLNFPCEAHEPSPAAPEECVYCEHIPACHAAAAVRP